MASIMDLMKGFIAPTPAANANPTPVPQAQAGQPNPVQPAAFQPSTTQPPQTQNPASPLDNHIDLFNITEVKPEDRKPTLDDPFINIDRNALQSEVDKLNFTDNTMQEQINAIAANNPAVAEAFVALLNNFGRQLYGRSAHLTATLADKATRAGVQRLNSDLPNTIRSNLTSNQLSELNPMFKHQAASPMIQALRQQIESKNPNATPTEIANQTVQYLNDFAAALKGGDPTQPKPVSNDGVQDFNELGFF